MNRGAVVSMEGEEEKNAALGDPVLMFWESKTCLLASNAASYQKGSQGKSGRLQQPRSQEVNSGLWDIVKRCNEQILHLNILF